MKKCSIPNFNSNVISNIFKMKNKPLKIGITRKIVKIVCNLKLKQNIQYLIFSMHFGYEN